jgi:hypothetical protein
MEDVWNLVFDLKKESENLKNTSLNTVIKDVFYQLPFFSCLNNFIDSNHQKDISKYLYCEDTKTPPHSGAYGDVPKTWKEKHFIIKQALAILYQEKKDQFKIKHGPR